MVGRLGRVCILTTIVWVVFVISNWLKNFIRHFLVCFFDVFIQNVDNRKENILFLRLNRIKRIRWAEREKETVIGDETRGPTTGFQSVPNLQTPTLVLICVLSPLWGPLWWYRMKAFDRSQGFSWASKISVLDIWDKAWPEQCFKGDFWEKHRTFETEELRLVAPPGSHPTP